MTRTLRRFAGISVLVAAMLTAGAATAGGAQAATGPVTLTVGTADGAALPASYVGFSFEANVLAGTAAAAGNLQQYLRTLGPGVLRFGGNFVDTTFWTSTGEKAPSWAVATLTPADLTRLATLATNSGWRVILGVNLKHPDPARAADEAAHARAALGDALLAIEIGNEPNYYSPYSSAQLWSDYQSYRAAINAAAPGVGLVAPSVGRVPAADAWLKDFASRETGHVDLADLTAHYYPACASSSPAPTISSLLSTGYRSTELARVQLLSGLAQGLGIPALLDEGNSVSCEGTDGVSDTYASALWGIDYELLGAQNGLSGLYLHSAIAKCGAAKPLYKAYTPFCALTDADATNGVEHVRPVYYAPLLVHTLGTGRFRTVSGGDLTRLRAYAIHDGSTLKLVLVNVTDPAKTGSLSATVKLGGGYTSGDTYALTAPSLATQSNILLGGHYVGKGGTFAGADHTPVAVNGSSLTLSLPAGSATVVTLHA